jgi:membrane protease YdiL (CAAX protease family)
MFLENGFSPSNKFWKYVVGSLIVLTASIFGQLPWVIAIAIKVVKSGKSFPTTEMEMMKFLDLNATLFLLLLSFVVALVAFFIVVKHLHKQSILSVTTTRAKIDWRRILFSFSLWAIITAGSTLLMFYTNPQDFVLNFKPIPFLILAIIGIVLIPIQTSTEEYVFRGYLMQGFSVGSLQKKFLIGILYTILFFPIYFAIELLIDNQITSKISFSSLIKVLILTKKK